LVELETGNHPGNNLRGKCRKPELERVDKYEQMDASEVMWALHGTDLQSLQYMYVEQMLLLSGILTWATSCSLPILYSSMVAMTWAGHKLDTNVYFFLTIIWAAQEYILGQALDP